MILANKVGRFWKFKLSEADDWIRSGGTVDDNAPEKSETDDECVRFWNIGFYRMKI